MSIPENKARKTKHQLHKQNYPDRHVVPENEIRALVGGLTIDQLYAFAALMQLIADATKQPLKGTARNELAESEIEQIKQVAAQGKHKRYQNVMKENISAIEQGGREGIDVTHRTASYAVQLAFEWTPEYLCALRQYAEKLRRMGPLR
jgi:hypothetical protein